MKIPVKIEGQKIRVESNLRKFACGTQKFIKFVFTFSEDWNGLTKFVQFSQNNKSYNEYLDNENSACLPYEVTSGKCVMVVCGTQGEIVAKTEGLVLAIAENYYSDSGESTNISSSLYSQLLDRIISIENNPSQGSGNSGVFVGEEEPQDPNVSIWIDPSGEETSFAIQNGSITSVKLSADINTKLNQAHSHNNKSILDSITSQKIASWDNRQNMVVDEELSSTSINPVQNKIITQQINALQVAFSNHTHNNLQSQIDVINETLSNHTHDNLQSQINTINAALNGAETLLNNIVNGGVG